MKTKSRRNKLKTKVMTQKMTKKRSINQKGGTLNTSAGVNGNSLFSKTSGTKLYDPALGRMRNQYCYNILGFIKFCRFDPDDTDEPEQSSKSWF